MNPPYRRTASASVARCAALALAAAPAFFPCLATAQQEAEPATSRQPSLWLEPRVTLQHTVTSNARLDSTAISDQVTEVSPGFRLVSNTARVKGFADYSLRGIHYAKQSNSSHVEHNLNANAVIEAVEQWAFVDVSGVVAPQSISVFGAPVNGSPANPNASQTASYRISPYLRGHLGSVADYEARYSLQDTRTDTSSRSNVTVQDWLLRVGSNKGQVLGWSVDGSQQTADFSLDRRIETSALRGTLNYAVTPQLLLSGVGGTESTNQISATRESHSIWGAGATWQPSQRTRLSVNGERRYFGNAYNVALEHRTARTVWRYTDSRGISNGQDAQSASLGPLFDLLNGFYAQIEPDPIRRAKLVLAEIDRLGLSTGTQVLPDFLRSSSTVQRMQQLSLALLGQRTMVTLTASHSNNRRLDGTLHLGDDFDTNANIRMRGVSLLLAHRLTPNTSIQASLDERRSVGTVPGLETRVRTLSLGLNTLLAPRTSGGIQVRRSLSDGSASPYSESAVVGTITHRF